MSNTRLIAIGRMKRSARRSPTVHLVHRRPGGLSPAAISPPRACFGIGWGLRRPLLRRSDRSRSTSVPGSTDKIGDEPGGQKRPARRVAERRPADASKSLPILPGIGFAFLLSSGPRSATQPPIEFRNRLSIALARRARVWSAPLPDGLPHGPRRSRHDAGRDARRPRRVARRAPHG